MFNKFQTKFQELSESIEMGVSVFFTDLKDIPNILQNPNNPKVSCNIRYNNEI